MSPTVRSGSRGHRIRCIGHGFYAISWYVEYKAGRILCHRSSERDTDRAGAERFAKKWNISMPPEA